MQVAFISDLHAGSERYSLEHMGRIGVIMQQCEETFLNGDMLQISVPTTEIRGFDDPQYHEGILSRTKNFLPFITGLCRSAPKATVNYLAGNHDGSKFFCGLMNNWHPDFGPKPANLHFHEHGYCLWGNMLVLHGDGFYEPTRNRRGSVISEMAESIKLEQKIQAALGDEFNNVEHIFGGHNHRANPGVLLPSGRKVYNSGSFSNQYGNGIIFVAQAEYAINGINISSVQPYYLNPPEMLHMCYDFDLSLTNVFVTPEAYPNGMTRDMMRDPEFMLASIVHSIMAGYRVSITTYKEPEYINYIQGGLRAMGVSELAMTEIEIVAKYNPTNKTPEHTGKGEHIDAAWAKHVHRCPSLARIKPKHVLIDDRDDIRYLAQRAGITTINPMRYGYQDEMRQLFAEAAKARPANWIAH